MKSKLLQRKVYDLKEVLHLYSLMQKNLNWFLMKLKTK